jgi:hypothetical protein
MVAQQFQAGDWVIYRKTKHSRSPGPRAANIDAAPHGDEYSYTVDKFWVVVGVNDDGTMLLKTRGGKQHTIAVIDHKARKAGWWDRWRYKDRFESVEGTTADATESEA